MLTDDQLAAQAAEHGITLDEAQRAARLGMTPERYVALRGLTRVADVQRVRQELADRQAARTEARRQLDVAAAKRKLEREREGS